MKFFVDSADVVEIREAMSWGLADGVTTNPSLLANDTAPDWYMLWYYAVLALLPRGMESVFMVAAPMAAIVFLLLVPVLWNKGERHPSRRPWAVAELSGRSGPVCSSSSCRSMSLASTPFGHVARAMCGPPPGPVRSPPPGRVSSSVHAYEDQHDEHEDDDNKHASRPVLAEATVA